MIPADGLGMEIREDRKEAGGDLLDSYIFERRRGIKGFVSVDTWHCLPRRPPSPQCTGATSFQLTASLLDTNRSACFRSGTWPLWQVHCQLRHSLAQRRGTGARYHGQTVEPTDERKPSDSRRTERRKGNCMELYDFFWSRVGMSVERFTITQLRHFI